MSPRNRGEQVRRFDPAIQWAEPWDDFSGRTKQFSGMFNWTEQVVKVGCLDYQTGYDTIGMDTPGYLVALHELGHKLSPTQPDWNSLSEMAKLFSVYTPKDRLLIVLGEIDAWQWAIDHCLTPVSLDDIDMICNQCLGSYFGNSPAHIMRRKAVVTAYNQLVASLEKRLQ